MGKVIKARVISGRFQGEAVRITNVSVDEAGRQSAACILADGRRANIPMKDLEVVPEAAPTPETPRASASMRFMGGSTGSRSLNQTKSLSRKRASSLPAVTSRHTHLTTCEICGLEYDQELRKGQPGKLTQCSDCAEETVNKVEGAMVYSHKTGATIEIKQDGELRHEAPIYDPKNKS